MAYNPDIQFRCSIIRGKSISKMDDLLPIYAEILNELCPISKDAFADEFDKRLTIYLGTDKTVSNHRTENVTKILGLVYFKNETVFLSRRTEKYLVDNDAPALFKSVCYSFQQVNGSQTISTIQYKVDNGISCRPFHFILKLLKLAYENDVRIFKQEVYYYVLNSLEVLQGRVSPQEVLNAIMLDRGNKVYKRVALVKNHAWTFQHMKEQLDYLLLANLIREDKDYVWLNIKEMKVINLFIERLNAPLAIDYYKEYDYSQPNIFNKIEEDWLQYFGLQPSVDLTIFNTSVNSLDIQSEESDDSATTVSTIEIGDMGEDYVMKYERAIVQQFNSRLTNRVLYFGKTRGLGYDITSIEANRAASPAQREMTRFIEVKTSTRVSPPSAEFQDTFNMTRNEWVVAQQQGAHYYIYRVYITNSGVFLHIITNPCGKSENDLLFASPVSYRVEYDNKAVDEQLEISDYVR